MLPLSVIQEVRRLIDLGQLSQRQIALKLDVSRGTVHAIATGKRGLHGSELETHDAETNFYSLPPQRCPGCGARVFLPCVLCRALAYRKQQETLRSLLAIWQVPKRVA